MQCSPTQTYDDSRNVGKEEGFFFHPRPAPPSTLVNPQNKWLNTLRMNTYWNNRRIALSIHSIPFLLLLCLLSHLLRWMWMNTVERMHMGHPHYSAGNNKPGRACVCSVCVSQRKVLGTVCWRTLAAWKGALSYCWKPHLQKTQQTHCCWPNQTGKIKEGFISSIGNQSI